MTGFHGAHVTIGVLCLIFVAFRAFQGKYTANNLGGVEIIGLYWHFVDLVWIILFTIVYLM
jgi:heme/copper-type cytochrome/quinol oxidase subunit 3